MIRTLTKMLKRAVEDRMLNRIQKARAKIYSLPIIIVNIR